MVSPFSKADRYLKDIHEECALLVAPLQAKGTQKLIHYICNTDNN